MTSWQLLDDFPMNEDCLIRVTTVWQLEDFSQIQSWLFTQQQNLQTYQVAISNRKRSNKNNCLGYVEKDLTSEKNEWISFKTKFCHMWGLFYKKSGPSMFIQTDEN